MRHNFGQACKGLIIVFSWRFLAGSNCSKTRPKKCFASRAKMIQLDAKITNFRSEIQDFVELDYFSGSHKID
jgi:hypothetical protein